MNKDLILREKLALQRTVLANQTTFLSFLRTSMYFLMAGLSLRNLFKVDDYMLLEILFYAISVSVLVSASVLVETSFTFSSKDCKDLCSANGKELASS